MARISGVEIPPNKRVVIGLTRLFGIGKPTSLAILTAVSIDPDKKMKDLASEDIVKLTRFIADNYKIEGDLRSEILMHKRDEIKLNTVKGIRLRKNMKVRGQRTKSNGASMIKKKGRPVAKKKKAGK